MRTHALIALTCACSRPTPVVVEQQPNSSESKPDAQVRAKPSPAAALVTLAAGPCARVDARWRCAVPGHPLLGRPDVILADGRWAGGVGCWLTDTRRLECHRNELAYGEDGEVSVKMTLISSFEHVEDFWGVAPGLLMVIDGRLVSQSEGDAGTPASDLDHIVDVEGPCVRTADRRLHCPTEALDDVDQFCVFDHVCAVRDEQVVCFGGNAELGLGAAVEGIPPTISVSCGADFGCAMTKAGEVWCWGDNHDGKLGQPASTRFSAAPLRVPQLDGIAGLRSFWGAYTCAAKADGALACWGQMPNGLPGLRDDQAMGNDPG